MADLTWFPLNCEDWDRRVRESRLSFCDEGALLRLCRGTWTAAEPCTIADDPDEFARLLGAQWERALPVLRANFTPHPDRAGWLRCTWLWELYERQLEKHLSYQQRGKKGGRPKSTSDTDAESCAYSPAISSANSSAKAQLSGDRPKTPHIRRKKAELHDSESSANSSAKAQLSQSSTEAFSSAPPTSEHRTKSPASSAALAPMGAALRVTDATGGSDRSARRKELEREYDAELQARLDKWTAKHTDDAAALEASARRELELPDAGEMSALQQRMLRGRMRSLYRVLPRTHPIPDVDTWIATREADSAEWVPDELHAEAHA